MVRRKGLEPPTYWFVASHSIQLSYRRIPTPKALQYISTGRSKMQALFKNFSTFFRRNAPRLTNSIYSGRICASR